MSIEKYFLFECLVSLWVEMDPRGVEMYLFYLPTNSVRNLWIQSLELHTIRDHQGASKF
jgi:hypothetical protein